MGGTKQAIISIFIVLAIIGGITMLITFFVATQSFGVKCTKAGYEGAAHERCVNRAANGGPIYEENIGRMNQQQH